jgi:hypothetical protein
MSVLTLITPLMLSSPSQVVQITPPPYSHISQSRIQEAQWGNGTSGTALCITTSTFNGTQTYGYNGQPSDNDSDQDHTGDCRG